MKVKSDHRSKFSNFYKQFTAMITLHFHPQPQYKYELYSYKTPERAFRPPPPLYWPSCPTNQWLLSYKIPAHYIQ